MPLYPLIVTCVGVSKEPPVLYSYSVRLSRAVQYQQVIEHCKTIAIFSKLKCEYTKQKWHLTVYKAVNNKGLHLTQNGKTTAYRSFKYYVYIARSRKNSSRVTQ